MASSLLDFVNNLAERAGKITCKYGHGDKIQCGIKYNDCDCFLE